jgi:hypothetical protein
MDACLQAILELADFLKQFPIEGGLMHRSNLVGAQRQREV